MILGAGRDGGIVGAAAVCGGMSFTAGTKVLLASGRAVPIARLRAGDKVLATNTRTGKTQAEPVTAVLVHHDTNRYDLTVKTTHGTAVIHTTTTTHLFWEPSLNKWVPAAKLRKGEPLKTPNGTTSTAFGGTTPRDHAGWMWDLTVTTDHDFYIQAVATILVHNCGGEQLPLFDDGPYRVGSDGRTRGVLELDGENIPLVSKEPSLGNYSASGHAEGQAALIMRERGAASGILSIDNPNGICALCRAQLPTLLPEGAVLDVRTPLGTVPRDPTWSNSRTFTGNPQDPLPWPR
jgi:hypothetical protein